MSMSNGVSPLTQAGRVLFVGALAMILMAPPTFAQSATSGAVIGTVNEQTGAVIRKADVQLTNVETNATQSQSTNGVGTYAFPNVAPGTYKITVKLAGFRTASISDVIVEVNKSVTVPDRKSTRLNSSH